MTTTHNKDQNFILSFSLSLNRILELLTKIRHFSRLLIHLKTFIYSLEQSPLWGDLVFISIDGFVSFD